MQRYTRSLAELWQHWQPNAKAALHPMVFTSYGDHQRVFARLLSKQILQVFQYRFQYRLQRRQRTNRGHRERARQHLKKHGSDTPRTSIAFNAVRPAKGPKTGAGCAG